MAQKKKQPQREEPTEAEYLASVVAVPGLEGLIIYLFQSVAKVWNTVGKGNFFRMVRVVGLWSIQISIRPYTAEKGTNDEHESDAGPGRRNLRPARQADGRDRDRALRAEGDDGLAEREPRGHARQAEEGAGGERVAAARPPAGRGGGRAPGAEAPGSRDGRARLNVRDGYTPPAAYQEVRVRTRSHAAETPRERAARLQDEQLAEIEAETGVNLDYDIVPRPGNVPELDDEG